MLRSLVKYWLLDIKHSPFANKRGRGLLSLLQKFINLLTKEEEAGNDNVFYNPQDLTSLRVGTDGSGGSPAVGDPVGMMLDTSGLSGSMEEFLGGQTELVTNGGFDTDTSGWTATLNGTLSWQNGVLRVTTTGGAGGASQVIPVSAGTTFLLSFDLVAETQASGTPSVQVNTGLSPLGLSTTGSHSFVVVAGINNPTLAISTGGAAVNGEYIEIDNISIKEIPGNHAIAPSDAARPTLMDDPDTTWSSLTDDGTRGEELVTNGTFDTDTTGWSVLSGTISAVDGRLRLNYLSGAYGTASYQIACEIGATYEFSVDLVTLNPAASWHQVWVGTSIGAANEYNSGQLHSAQTISVQFTATATTQIIQLLSHWGVGSTYAEFDNISIRKVNTAFDGFNSNSEINVTQWGYGGGTVTTGQADADGGTSAVLIEADNTLNRKDAQTIQQLSPTAGRLYKFQIYIKAGTATYCQLTQTTGGFFNNHYVNVDMVSGTISYDGTGVDFNAPAPTISDAGGGWYLVNWYARADSSPNNTSIFVGPVTTATAARLELHDQELSLYAYKPEIFEKTRPNLVVSNENGDDSTFDTDTGNWTKGTGWSIGSGVASFDGTTAFSQLSISAGTSGNVWYLVRWYMPSVGGSLSSIRLVSSGSGVTDVSISGAGWYSQYIQATSGSGALGFQSGSATGVGYDFEIDNISVQELPSTTPTSYYLDTDGTDDWMQVTPTLDLGEQWWHTGAWQSDTAGGRPFATSEIFQGAPRDVSGDWVWYDPSVVTQTICTSDPATKHVLTIEQSDTNSLSARYDGVTEADPITPYDDSGAVQGLALFSQQNVSYSSGIDGRFYGGAWGQGQVDYDELTTLQDYLGTLVEPDIDPTDVTSYANVYEMLSAQTAAALFDIDDTTSLTTYRDGRITQPVDGDPVGQMMSVAGTGGQTLTSAPKTTLGTLADFTGGSGPDNNEWTQIAQYQGGPAAIALGDASGYYKVTADIEVLNGADWSLYFRGAPPVNPNENQAYNNIKLSAGRHTISVERFYDSGGNITCKLEPRSTTNFGTVRVYSLTVEHIPGYVATAPSDSARPTLASVLDETASELTDDGTRGDELVTNGTFDTDVTGWSADTDTSISFASGSMRVELISGTNPSASASISTEIGETYEFQVEITGGTQSGWRYIRVGTGAFGSNVAEFIDKLDGTSLTVVFQATATTTYITVLHLTSTVGQYLDYDNISVKKVQTVFDGRGDELVPNQFGDGWAFDPSATVLNEQVTASSVLGNIAYYYSPTLFGVPRTLEVTFTISNYVSGSVQPRVGATNAFSAQSANGTFTEVATVDGSYEYLNMFGSSFTGTISDISVKEVLTPNLLLTSAGDDDSTFDTDTGNWFKGGTAAILGGVVDLSGTNYDYIYRTILSAKPIWYKVQFYVAGYTSGALSVALGSTVPGPNKETVSANGWHTVFLQDVAGGNGRVTFQADPSFDGTIDNVIVQEVPASVARAFYLDFDGVDDNLILDGTDFGSSTNATLYKTFRGDTADNAHMMFASLNWYILTASNGSAATGISANVGSPVFREDGAIASYATRGDVFTALVDNTDHTIGVEEADLSIVSAWGSTGFYIGGEYDTTWDSTGRLYSWAAVDTRLDGRNRDLLENFMISKKP